MLKEIGVDDMSAVSWDGILGFFGAVIGVFGAWFVSSLQYKQPQKSALKKYSYTLSKELTELLKTSFHTDSNGSFVHDERYPSDILRGIIESTDNILNPYYPFLRQNKIEIVNKIKVDLDDLQNGLTSFWMKNSNATKPHQVYPLKDQAAFVNQVDKIQKLLDRL